MIFKNYKWGYLTAIVLIVMGTVWFWMGWPEPRPPDWESGVEIYIGWLILFFLAGIGILLRKSFGWYLHYAAFGLVGAISFSIGVGFMFQPLILQMGLDFILGLILLIVGLGLLVMIPFQRRYWRQHQGKTIGNFNRHLLYVLGSLPIILFIFFTLMFIRDPWVMQLPY